MNLPKISIVTPSYNQASFLEATIQSVLNQNYPNLEYMIVDGGSTDGSLEIIKKYSSRLAWWVSEKDKGQTHALNKGFARATGDIFAWINSDDVYEPNAFVEAAEYLQAHPDLAMVYGDANYINAEGRVIGYFPAAQTDYKKLRDGFVHVPQQSSFFRADLWKKVAPLDESFYFAMDYDLWVRLSAQAPLQYNPRLWANFRLHGAGKSVIADDRCWPEMIRVHYRDGGKLLAPITIKYFIRTLIAPLWRLRMQLRLNR